MFGEQPAKAQNNLYGSQQNVVAPKELGLIQRVEGVRTGLDQIHDRLHNLAERIAGGGNSEAEPDNMPAGIPGNLSICETRVRQIFELLNGFDQTF